MSVSFVLVGLPKSGSTWLQSMLDAHPRIACLKEHKFTDLGARFRDAVAGYMADRAHGIAKLGQEPAPDPFPRDLHHDLTAVAVNRLLASIAAANSTVQAHGFKDNLVNPLFVLERTEAQVVMLTRDPRDIVVSAWRSSEGKSGAVPRLHGTLNRYARRYIDYWMRQMRDRLRALEEAPGRCRLVTYEGLHRDPSGSLAGLCDFLAVERREDEISTAVGESAFARVTGGMPGEEDVRRHARKGIVGDWRNHLDPAVAAWMRDRCADRRLARFFVQDQTAEASAGG